MDIDNLLLFANNSIITIQYREEEKDLIVPCTLNKSLCDVLSAKPIPKKSFTHIYVWAIDIADCKSIKIDTITNWYIGHPR